VVGDAGTGKSVLTKQIFAALAQDQAPLEKRTLNREKLLGIAEFLGEFWVERSVDFFSSPGDCCSSLGKPPEGQGRD